MKVYYISKEKRKLLYLLLIISYYILLNIAYSSVICKRYAYMGMYIDSNAHLKWGVIFLISAVVMVFYLNRERVSSVIIALLYMLWFVPGTVMFSFRKSDFGWMIVLFFVLILLFNKIPFLNFQAPHRISLTGRSLMIFSVLLVALSFYIWARYAGFHIQTSIVDVYGLRSEAREFGMSTFLTYCRSASRSVIPTFLILSLLMKKRLISVFLIFAQLLVFFTDGTKSTFFSLLLILFLYFYIKNLNAKISLIDLFVLGLVIVLAFSLIEPILLGSTNILDIFVRRVMFAPHLLNYCYYDFFSTHAPDYLHQSILRHFGFSSEYTMKIPFLIGKIYFSSPNMGANNGLFSDAFSNFGILGLIIGPALIAFFLKILDICAYGLNPIILIPACITLSMSFISSVYFTVLLTHGALFVCIFLYLIPRQSLESRLSI